MKRKGFWELIIRRQKIEKGGKREMRTRFFGFARYVNGDPTGFESECKIYSSKLGETGKFISWIDGISIKEITEMGLFPLLVKEAIESVLVFISGKTNSGFMISASTLSVDVSPKWIWVEPSCRFKFLGGTLALDCVGLG
jgi:hypothetical protein